MTLNTPFSNLHLEGSPWTSKRQALANSWRPKHTPSRCLPLQHSNVARRSLDQSPEVSTSSSETSRTFSKLQRRLVMMSQSSSSAAFTQNSVSRSSNCETQPQAVGKDVSAMAAMTLTPKFTGLCGTVLCFAMNPSTGNMVQIRALLDSCLLYTSPSPRDLSTSRMPSSA